MLSPDERRAALRIIARASTPVERRTCPAFAPVSGQPAVAVQARIHAWTAAVAPLPLELLLEAEGLDQERFARGLADAQVVDERALPRWGRTLLELLAQTADEGRADAPEGPVVQTLLRPFLHSAAAWLQQRAAGPVRLAPAATEAMVAALARRLSPPVDSVLAYEQGQLRALAPLLGGTDRALWAAAGGGRRDWLDRLERFPALGRLIGVLYADWRDALAELFVRLAHDRRRLRARFFGGRPLGTLTGFRADAGDHHDHGRTVAVLEFSGGRRLVYKPRDPRIAVAFNRLAETLNQAGAPLALHTRPLWARPGYLWDSYVEPVPCASGAAVERFYRRAGMQIRLLQLLGAFDIHADNLIACGEHPVCIDPEMLMQPPQDLGGLLASERQAHRALADSPLYSGMVVSYMPQGAWRRAEDIGALTPARDLRLAHAISATEAADSATVWPMDQHAPRLDGRPMAADGYLGAIQVGYRAMQAFLLAKRDLLLSAEGPLLRCAAAQVRFLRRDTPTYQQILLQSLAPALLADGLQRELFLAGLLREAASPQQIAVARSEIAALRELDVPLFLVPAGQTTLIPPDGPPLPGFLHGTPLSQALDRTAALPLFEQERQEELLRTTVAAGAHPPPPLPPLPSPAPEQPDWLGQAVELGDALLAAALCGPAGDLAWLGLSYRPAQDWRALEVLPPDLLSGSCGLALVLADLFRLSGQARFRAAALGALAGTRRALDAAAAQLDLLRGPATPLRRPFFCGVFYGLGAQLYALQRCAALLDAPEQAEAARACAGLLPVERIVAHAPVDLVCGGAGLLLALLADPSPRLADRERAAAVAELLLDGREERGAWIGPPYPAGTRFLEHLPDTAGGLALAFARLLDAGDLPAGLAGRLRRALDELAGPPSQPSPGGGALLARLALGRAEQQDALLAQAAAALPAAPSALGSDALLGALQLALGALRCGGGARFRLAAEQSALTLLARRRHTGSLFPDDHAADRHRLSALHGLAAVIHVLLALHAPDRIVPLNTPV